MSSLSAPTELTLAVTGRCNLRCKHCFVPQRTGKYDMSTSKMLRVIDEIGRLKVFEVSLFGGEPLLRRDLPLLINRLRKYRIRLSMNTNATLMDESTAAYLVNQAGIKNFVVSLDGTKRIHERQRGSGTFVPALKGIKNLLNAGAHVLLSFTVTKLNYRNIREFAKLSRKLGVNQVRFNHVFYGGSAACYLADMYLTPKEELGAIKNVTGLSRKYPPEFILGSYLQQGKILKNISKSEAVHAEKITVKGCGAANKKCAIRADGWVVPCEVVWDAKAGNLRKHTLQHIWKKSKLMNAFRDDMIVDISKWPDCVECEYKTVCFTGHRCYPYYYPGGGINNRDLYCRKKGI